MKRGRLNVFQRLARTWDAVHPYNAGQAFRISRTFSPHEIHAGWNATLQAFSFAMPVEVRELRASDDLFVHFTREMNRPFGTAPFRPFVQRLGDSTWFGVAYQHWIADSFSIRLMLRELITRLLGSSSNQSEFRHSDGHAPGDFSFETMRSLLRRYSDYRHTRKIHTMGSLDYPVSVRVVPRLDCRASDLVRYARGRGAKLNDVLLAALCEACHSLMPVQQNSGRRNLAVSSIIDLRSRLSNNRRADFGCLLGFNSVVCRPAELRDWDRLLTSVASQRRPAATGSALMLTAEFLSRWTPPSRVYDFYRKEAPFAGGVSNVNLNNTWFAEQHPKLIQEYIRVSPTGPMVPLALNVTTLGESLAITMTYRTNLLNDWTAAEIGQSIARRLMRAAEEGAS